MESKYAGYMGKVMLVDLTTETVTEYPWSDEYRELYLGGKIMAARILCDHLTGKETAFSEENWIVIKALEKLVEGAGGEIAAEAAVLAEGDAADRTDIIFLEKLPLFFK